MIRFADLSRFIVLSSIALLAYTQQAAVAQDSSHGNCVPNYIYAQRLIDETIARHPELTALVMHVTPPGSSENIVIASNIWLIGEKSDDDDVGVIKSGKTMTEMNSAGNKYEVQGVLENVLGATVGSVATVFPYKKGESTDLLQKRAAEIRAELSKHILNSTNLMEPFPFDPQIPWNTVARTVMERETRKYPDVLVFAMQVKTPNRQSNVIVASNIGRIGKIGDDPKDILVITTGKPNATLKSSDQRAQVVLPLKDSTGMVIGVLNLLLHNGEDKDEARMIARGELIRDDTATLIPGMTALFEPVHP